LRIGPPTQSPGPAQSASTASDAAMSGDDRRAKVALALGAGALGAACLSLYLQHRRRSFAGHVSLYG